MTRQQKILLDYIRMSIRINEYSPSYQEMMEYMKLRSKSGIHRMVKCLVEQGMIRHIPGHARTIELISLPAQAVHHQQIRAENGVWVFFKTPEFILDDKCDPKPLTTAG